MVITGLYCSTIHLHETSKEYFYIEDQLSKYTGILIGPWSIMLTKPIEVSMAKNDISLLRYGIEKYKKLTTLVENQQRDRLLILSTAAIATIFQFVFACQPQLAIFKCITSVLCTTENLRVKSRVNVGWTTVSRTTCMIFFVKRQRVQLTSVNVYSLTNNAS